MSVERMQLPDGRVFEYSAAGDPGRELLVFCVGTPSAVVDFPYVADAAAARGLRSVICSRPGYGGSTRNEGRTVADAASDTAALADHLGAERFLVAGWSGGGSTALACAALLPDRVRAAVDPGRHRSAGRGRRGLDDVVPTGHGGRGAGADDEASSRTGARV